MTRRYTVSRAMESVADSDDGLYGVLMRHGTLELGFYRPRNVDDQDPHNRDEVYIVQSGSGYFVLGDERRPFESGEALFVPAGVTHRFEDFSADFAAWVIFYGPMGGEASESST